MESVFSIKASPSIFFVYSFAHPKPTSMKTLCRPWIVLLCVPLALATCKKDEEDNGNGDPTPPEPEEYYIDFSSGNAEGWFAVDGTWIVENNVYKVMSDPTLFANTCYLDSVFSGYALEVRVRKTAGEPCNIGVSFNGDPSSVGPLGNWNNTYKLIFCTHNGWSIGKIVDTAFTEFEQGNSPDIQKGPGVWNTLTVKVFNGTIEVFFNGIFQGSYLDDTFPSGKIGLSMFDEFYGGVAEFDYVKIIPLEAKDVPMQPTQPWVRPVFQAGSYQGDCPSCRPAAVVSLEIAPDK